ncbi:hypothetical protein PV326_011120 [Microctonus aethiopoides]|nr:hypothetical protein PV326_011120 [Microctonus aethiopoides]
MEKVPWWREVMVEKMSWWKGVMVERCHVIVVNEVLELWKQATLETKISDYCIKKLNQLYSNYRSFGKYQQMNDKKITFLNQLSSILDVSQDNSLLSITDSEKNDLFSKSISDIIKELRIIKHEESDHLKTGEIQSIDTENAMTNQDISNINRATSILSCRKFPKSCPSSDAKLTLKSPAKISGNV